MNSARGFKYDRDIAEIYARHRGVRPELLKILVEESGVARDSHALEVGCGTGNYIIAVQFVSGCTAITSSPCSSSRAAPPRASISRRKC